MNTKRIIFWICFLIVLALIVWGLAVAMNKPLPGTSLGTPPEVTATDHVTGNVAASITLIEYSDFQCPACAAFYPAVERLAREASSTVKLVYRHFPLPQHKNAELAARASEAAGKQGKFWEMYRSLFDNQTTWEVYSDAEARAEFATYASKLGLDMTQYATDLDSAETKDHVALDRDGGVRIGINATPSFFVNGTFVSLQPTYDQFKAGIEAAAQTRIR
jgi:protein-disulfide isomerase